MKDHQAHVGAVVEFFHLQSYLNFLSLCRRAGLFADRIGQHPGDRVFGPDALSRNAVELAWLQFAVAAPPLNDGLDRDEVDDGYTVSSGRTG